MRVNVPIEIPEESVQEIMKEAQKQMAKEVLEYLDEIKGDMAKAGTDEARFTMYGMRLCEKKLEKYA